MSPSGLRLPGSQGLGTERSFYSFDMGGVHFLVLDTESPSDPGSPQGAFVAADLAKVGWCVTLRWKGLLRKTLGCADRV